MTGWIDGKETALPAAAAAIAKTLGSSRNPLILVDAIDLAGAAAVVELARTAGATLDHAEPSNIKLMQQQGWIGTTPGEAGLRSDAVLFVGPLTPSLPNDEAYRKLAGGHPQRAHYYLGPQATAPAIPGLIVLDTGNAPVFEALGVLRALVAGRKIPAASQALRDAAEAFKAKKYGIVAFSSGVLDDVTGYSAAGLVEDLSATTRWTALPLGAAAGQSELIRMSLALTRLPPPVSFGVGAPVHDAWLYSGANMLKRGEVDAALWVASSERPLPDALSKVGRLAVVSSHRQPLRGVGLQIETGVAGVDHAAIIDPPELGAFTALTPAKASSRASVASVLRAITQELAPQEASA